MLITALRANNEPYYRPDGIRLEGLRDGQRERRKDTERLKDRIVKLKEKVEDNVVRWNGRK